MSWSQSTLSTSCVHGGASSRSTSSAASTRPPSTSVSVHGVSGGSSSASSSVRVRSRAFPSSSTLHENPVFCPLRKTVTVARNPSLISTAREKEKKKSDDLFLSAFRHSSVQEAGACACVRVRG